MFLTKTLLSQVSSQLIRSTSPMLVNAVNAAAHANKILTTATPTQRPIEMAPIINLTLTTPSSLKLNERTTLSVEVEFARSHFKLTYRHPNTHVALHSKSLPYVWLRASCECAQCYNRESAETEVDLSALDLSRQTPRNVSEMNSGVHVEWQDGHTSAFGLDELGKLVLGKNKLLGNGGDKGYNGDKVLWNREMLESRGGLKRVDYDAYLTDDKALAQTLTEILKYGAVVISGVPAKETEMTRLTSRIGPIQSSHFGTQHCLVTANLMFADRAYTQLALRAHTDTAYMKNCAGLELFHVIRKPADGGGQSLLVDGFYCADKLRETHPAEFEFLNETKVEQMCVKEGVSDFRHMAPVIEIDSRTRHLQQIRFNPYNKINLSHLTLEEIEFYYKSMQKFINLVQHKSNEYWISLNPDEVLIFDNFRLLHGRSAFKGERTLVTAYLSRDDWLSKANMLNNC